MVKKSCTSWFVVYPIIYRVLYSPGGAGFLPSTVLQLSQCPKFRTMNITGPGLSPFLFFHDSWEQRLQSLECTGFRLTWTMATILCEKCISNNHLHSEGQFTTWKNRHSNDASVCLKKHHSLKVSMFVLWKSPMFPYILTNLKDPDMP